jgi:hypothetical protein
MYNSHADKLSKQYKLIDFDLYSALKIVLIGRNEETFLSSAQKISRFPM